MRNQFKLLTLGTLGLLAASCSNKVTMPEPGVPVFGQFTYTGKDAVYEKNPLNEGEFYNPILQGCYPDPSICKKVPTITWYALLLPSTPECPFSTPPIWSTGSRLDMCSTVRHNSK